MKNDYLSYQRAASSAVVVRVFDSAAGVEAGLGTALGNMAREKTLGKSPATTALLRRKPEKTVLREARTLDERNEKPTAIRSDGAVPPRHRATKRRLVNVCGDRAGCGCAGRFHNVAKYVGGSVAAGDRRRV